MIADLHILTGARAGASLTITGEVVAGRAPGLGLRFDPDRDLSVSARHATILFTEGRWIVRDLGSRNGTFVNGRRVREADLEDGDRIRFGTGGPEVRFGVSASGTKLVRAHGRTETTGHLTALVHANRRLRFTAAVLAVALGLAIGYTGWSLTRQRSDWEREREALLSRVDSALDAGDETVRTLTGEREGLALALRDAQDEVRRVRSELERATDDDTVNTADLRRQLQSAMAALDRQQLAASIDYNAIEERTRRAVAVVWVENPDGTVSTGTAFAVRPDGTMATSRHVLTGNEPQARPRRLAVQFADSRQVWPAHILGISADADAALIRVENILGEVPTVGGLNLRIDTLQAGTPIAWIGFPLGGETWPQDPGSGRIARPLGAVGIITGVDSVTITFQGYGAAGASGSPIVDETGAVIGILTGGASGDRNRQLIGVPVAAVDALLRDAASLRSGLSPS